MRPIDIRIAADILGKQAKEALDESEKQDTLSREQRRKLDKQLHALIYKLNRWTRDFEKAESASLAAD
jgi:hypothetical protein